MDPSSSLSAWQQIGLIQKGQFWHASLYDFQGFVQSIQAEFVLIRINCQGTKNAKDIAKEEFFLCRVAAKEKASPGGLGFDSEGVLCFANPWCLDG